jgi:hypothetical protein
MAGTMRAGIKLMSMAIAVMTLGPLNSASAASPDAPREDVFGRSTGTQPATRNPRNAPQTTVHIAPSTPAPMAPHPVVSAASPPQQWFDAYDAYVSAYRPSEADQIKMSKPFNQEVERVTDFCNTVAKISRNYRILAQKIRSLPVPTSIPEAKDYRDLMADWYNDSALVYEDMIRPRPAARTKEELNNMIQDVKDRSETLKSNSAKLAQMDSDIRLRHTVQPPKYDDALNTYAGHH